MPIHDWTRVDAGLFHAFHFQWISALCNTLNAGGTTIGLLRAPRTIDQRADSGCPYARARGERPQPDRGTPALAVATVPPRARLIRQAEDRIYVRKANRVAVRHRHGQIVAVVEIVSPGNKASRLELRNFVEKSADPIMQGVHLLVVDLFPPSKRDPYGIHKAIWDEFQEEDLELPPGKPLTLASYDAGPPPIAYAEFVSVGDALPPMPIFLKPEFYVPAPLESSYQSAWGHFPAPMKRLLERPGRAPARADVETPAIFRTLTAAWRPERPWPPRRLWPR